MYSVISCPWQVYHALLQPRSMLWGRSALEGVTDNLDKLVRTVSTAVKASERTPLRVGVA